MASYCCEFTVDGINYLGFFHVGSRRFCLHEGTLLRRDLLPIVNDELEWNDDKDKSKGYTLKNGKKVYQTEDIPVNVGGRPKKK